MERLTLNRTEGTLYASSLERAPVARSKLDERALHVAVELLMVGVALERRVKTLARSRWPPGVTPRHIPK